jgi:hypothetical protein
VLFCPDSDSSITLFPILSWTSLVSSGTIVQRGRERRQGSVRTTALGHQQRNLQRTSLGQPRQRTPSGTVLWGLR